MEGRETKKEEVARCNSDGRSVFSENGTAAMHATFLAGGTLSITPPRSSQPLPSPQEASPAARGRQPRTSHPPPGDSYSDGVRAALPAKFVRPKAFLWEDAGLSSCSLAMIKVRLVPKPPFILFPYPAVFKADGSTVFSAVINLSWGRQN